MRVILRVFVCLTTALMLSTILTAPVQAAEVFATPKNLTSTAQTLNSVSLQWDAVADAPQYRIQMATNSAMSGATYYRVIPTNRVMTGLKANTKYYFKVRVITADGGNLSSYSAAITATTAAPPPPPPGADLHVGSFNLYGANNDSSSGGEKQKWTVRKPHVIADILGEKADVVGLQEANQSTIYNLPGGVNQFTDLRNGLNDAGQLYELANTNSYNCAKPTSSNNCSYVDQGASNATRIIYNTATLTKLSDGSVKYASQSSGKTDRYMAWAKFDQKSTGKDFFFVTTHLDPYSSTVRKAEWKELIAKVKVLNTDQLPVVITGDFNTSKFSTIAESMLPTMKSAGFLDVLNQEFKVNPPRNPPAQKLTNAWINSFNDFRRDIKPYSYYTARTKAGNGIDWIFTTSMQVKEYKVVIDFDPSTLKVIGVFPSDHNMIRATLVLP